MTKDYTKLIVRSFNNECDASIINVKFNNVESIEKKIRKAYDTLNTLAKRLSISISSAYLELKLQELFLCHEYQVAKQKEKEEIRQQREKQREDAKLIKEIEEMKEKLEKEENHFTRALSTLSEQLEKAEGDTERQLLEKEKASIENELAKIEIDRKDIQYREQNTRAGYVYVISNIGAFGEDVYKIGVTRRLEPQDRVDELGDSSVPFRFDVHAMIFSDDAPALENAIHRAFENSRINMINARKEFFRIPLGEIEKVVRENFSKPVEITRLADAADYRESLKMREALLKPA
jgi:L-rhamnose mutarotase